MKNITLLFFALYLCNLNSQNIELYEKETFIFENDTLNYRILKPLN